MSGFKMDDYVDVAERIRMFSDKYPDGSLQSTVQLIGEPPVGVLCVASAYRTPDDPRPGVGHAYEPIPGKTPYTKDSEVMNAETSAWGRAIVALGFETKKIASANEVRSRTGGGTVAGPDASSGAARGDSRTAGGPAAPSPAGALAADVQVHFGKNEGKRVADLTMASRRWYIEKWEPGGGDPRDATLKAALIAYDADPAATVSGGPSFHDPQPTDEIPF